MRVRLDARLDFQSVKWGKAVKENNINAFIQLFAAGE